VASGASVGSLSGELSAPLPLYRFWNMKEQATELTTKLINFGQTLLSYMSRQDDKGLARLRAGLDFGVF
jgi:hypothetical protein